MKTRLIAPLSQFISSGVYSLDLRLGGGWPRGAISEIHGGVSSGKTVLTMNAIKEAIRCNQEALFVDSDYAFPMNYARDTRVPVDKLDIGYPRGPDWLRDVIDTGDYDIIFVDTINTLNSSEHGPVGLNNDIEGIVEAAINTNTALVFLTQHREMSASGGILLRHFVKQVVELDARGPILEWEAAIGRYINCTVHKSRGVIPFRSFQLYAYPTGIGITEDIVELALGLGILSRSGSWIQHQGTAIGQGVRGCSANLSPDLYSSLEQSLACQLATILSSMHKNEPSSSLWKTFISQMQLEEPKQLPSLQKSLPKTTS